MKKLLAALVISLSTAALARSASNEQTKSKSEAQQENERNDATRARTGVEATDVMPGLSGSKASKEKKQSKGEKEQAEANLMKARAFDVSGRLKSASRGGVTLSRQEENLPDVELSVRDQTAVMLDGKKAVLNSLPEGSEVRARFNLDGSKAVAVELDAKSPKAESGSSKKSTQPPPQQ